MGEVVNLRRARKAKARDEAVVQAAANRAAHGRTPAEKRAVLAEVNRRARELGGAKRDR